MNRSTEIGDTGKVTWNVTFTDGTYRYVCDPHSGDDERLVHRRQRHAADHRPPPPGSKPVTSKSKLQLTSGPGFTITLKTTAGKAVKSMKTGTYTVVVRDRSRIHNAHLVGPGYNRATKPLTYTGSQTWKVKLARAGTLRFLCDPHALQGMKGSAKIVRPTADAQTRAAGERQTGPAWTAFSVSESAVQIAIRPVMPVGVHALEAPPRHLRRDAVAPLARGTEPQGVRSGHARRVQRRAEERGTRDVIARVELELAEQVAPVGRQRRDHPVPGIGKAERRGRHGCARRWAVAAATSISASVPHTRLRSRRESVFLVRSAPPSERVTWKRSSSPTSTGCSGPRTAAASANAPSGANASRSSTHSGSRASSIRAH